jgi:hypothetical protein
MFWEYLEIESHATTTMTPKPERRQALCSARGSHMAMVDEKLVIPKHRVGFQILGEFPSRKALKY